MRGPTDFTIMVTHGYLFHSGQVLGRELLVQGASSAAMPASRRNVRTLAFNHVVGVNFAYPNARRFSINGLVQKPSTFTMSY